MLLWSAANIWVQQNKNLQARAVYLCLTEFTFSWDMHFWPLKLPLLSVTPEEHFNQSSSIQIRWSCNLTMPGSARQIQLHHSVSESRSSSSMQDKEATWGKIFSVWDSTKKINKLFPSPHGAGPCSSLGVTEGGRENCWALLLPLPLGQYSLQSLGVTFSSGDSAALTMMTSYAQHHPNYMVKTNWTAV